MLIHWSQFNEPEPAARLAKLQARVFEIAERSSELSFADLRSAFERLGVGISVESTSSSQLALVYDEPRGHAWAKHIADIWQGKPELLVGRAAGEFEAALRAAVRYGVNLSSSRVRIGFTRGHLMDVVVQIPLDVPGDEESLQVASEVFLEHYLGDELLDCWVNSVGVDRIARTRGLMMMEDSRKNAESHPLSMTRQLLERGVLAVNAQLPSTLLRNSAELQWTALSMAPPLDKHAHDLPQADRVFASSAFPEALKSCLEGLPFCSARFTHGGELFAWLRYNGNQVEDRLAAREQVEQLLASETHLRGVEQRRFLLAGTGFGPTYDYVDLWILPDAAAIAEVGQRVANIVGHTQLGFYDNRIAEVLQFRG